MGDRYISNHDTKSNFLRWILEHPQSNRKQDGGYKLICYFGEYFKTNLKKHKFLVYFLPIKGTLS